VFESFLDRRRALDPVIMVSMRPLWALFYLVQDAALEIWRNIGEKDVLRIDVFRREFRIEIAKTFSSV